MRVVHIGYNVDGGAGLGMIRLHRDLLTQGVQSRVLCMKRGKEESVSKFPPSLRRRGRNRNIPFLLLHALRIWDSPYYRALRMATALKEKYGRTVSSPFSTYPVEEHPLVRKADVIHLHWVSNFVDLPSFLKTIRKPVVWTIRDENPFLGYWHFRCDIPDDLLDSERREDEWLRAEKLRAIRSCQTLAFASLSRATDDFVASCPAAEGRFHCVIPNSVDGVAFHPADGAAVRREYGIGPDTKLLVFVSQGLHDPRKGLPDLLEAVSSMARTDIAILCVGSGRPTPLPKNVRVMLEGRVTETERLSALFSAADLFVTPSHAETFGKTTTEALACGTPVVSYPNAGAMDIVGSEDGVLAADFTADALRAAIAEALSRRFDREALRARVLDRFSPVRVTNAYVRLYERLLSGPADGNCPPPLDEST